MRPLECTSFCGIMSLYFVKQNADEVRVLDLLHKSEHTMYSEGVCWKYSRTQ